MLKKIICPIFLLLCINCSNNQLDSSIEKDKNKLVDPSISYQFAKVSFEQQNFELAKNQFKEIKKLYPLSNEAIESEIMIAFINYIQMDYDMAILNYNKIINKYPSHKDLDYIYYMIDLVITYYSIHWQH